MNNEIFKPIGYENIKIQHVTDFLIHTLRDYGNLKQLTPLQKSEIDSILDKDFKSNRDHRALLLQKIISSFEGTCLSLQYAETDKAKELQEKLNRLGQGAEYAQSMLNLKLTEMFAYTECGYHPSQADSQFFPSNYSILSQLIPFLFKAFPNKKDTTDFLMANIEPQITYEFCTFMNKEENKNFIENHFTLTHTQEVKIFKKCVEEFDTLIEADSTTYAQLKGHVLLSKTEKSKSLKNKLLLEAIFDPIENMDSFEDVDFEDDLKSAKHLHGFLCKIKADKLDAEVPDSLVEKLVEFYLHRNYLKTVVWRSDLKIEKIMDLPNIIKRNEEIVGVLRDITNMWPGAKKVGDMYQSESPQKFLKFLKSNFGSGFDFKKEPAKFMHDFSQSQNTHYLVASHRYHQTKKDYPLIEKALLHLDMAATPTKSISAGAYKI